MILGKTSIADGRSSDSIVVLHCCCCFCNLGLVCVVQRHQDPNLEAKGGTTCTTHLLLLLLAEGERNSSRTHKHVCEAGVCVRRITTTCTHTHNLCAILEEMVVFEDLRVCACRSSFKPDLLTHISLHHHHHLQQQQPHPLWPFFIL